MGEGFMPAIVVEWMDGLRTLRMNSSIVMLNFVFPRPVDPKNI